MPNWVRHDLKITGAELELERFMDACFTTMDGEQRFDFDKLIPQPEHIKASTGENVVPYVCRGTTFNISRLACVEPCQLGHQVERRLHKDRAA